MDNQFTYQIVVMGPSADRYPDLLGGKIRESFNGLGLDPGRDLEVLGGDQIADVNWRGSPVGVWFGGKGDPDPGQMRMVDRLKDEGCPILPMLSDLQNCPSELPGLLQTLNARQWDDPRIAGDLLRALRLTRDLRQCFISYRRLDSRRFAEGLFDALSERGFHVFLDTASVEATEPFQDVLWDRLADMDLLVLLDSPNALTSRWLNDELVQVNNLGLGVLQLIWPGHTPSRESAFSTPLPMTLDDFENRDSGPDGRPTVEVLTRITTMAESVRIESLAARRRRVVGEFVARASTGWRVEVQAVGPLVLRALDSSPDADPVAIILPVVGLPDAHSLYRERLALDEFRLRVRGVDDATVIDLIKDGKVQVVYDGLGVRADRAKHLIWLNQYLPLRTSSIDRQESAASQGHGDLEAWLDGLGKSHV